MATRGRLRSKVKAEEEEPIYISSDSNEEQSDQDQDEEEFVRWCQEAKVDEEDIKEDEEAVDEIESDDFDAGNSEEEVQPGSDLAIDPDYIADLDFGEDSDDDVEVVKPKKAKKGGHKLKKSKKNQVENDGQDSSNDSSGSEDNLDNPRSIDEVGVRRVRDRICRQDQRNYEKDAALTLETDCQVIVHRIDEAEGHQDHVNDKDDAGQDTSDDDDEVIKTKFRKKRKVRQCRKDQQIRENEESESDLDDDPRVAKKKAFEMLKESRKRRLSRTSTDQPDQVQQHDQEEQDDNDDQGFSSDGSEVDTSPTKKLRYLDESSSDCNDDNTGESETGDDSAMTGSDDADEDDQEQSSDSEQVSSDEGETKKTSPKKKAMRADLNEILASLSRSTEKDRSLTNDYHNKVCEEEMIREESAKERRRKQAKLNQKKKKKGKGRRQLTYSSSDDSDNEVRGDKHTDISKVRIYEPLMRALRPMASREGLSDVEVIREFILYDTQIDPECGGVCTCTKERLKFNHFIHNKNIEDDFKRTFDYTICVGSECIKHFETAGSPVAFFRFILCTGAMAYFQNKKKNGDYVFKLAGKAFKYLKKNWMLVRQDYTLPVEIKKLRKKKEKNQADKEGPKYAFVATVTPGKKLQVPKNFLKKDHRYRIHLNPHATEKPKFPNPTPLAFRLVSIKDVEAEAAEVRENRINDPKSFILNV